MIFKHFTKLFGEIEIKRLTLFFNRLVDELNTGLSRLTLTENFESHLAEVTIDAGDEEAIAHNLGVVPSGRIILKHSGDSTVVDGDTEWDKNNIYLQNTGASSVTLTVLILK